MGSQFLGLILLIMAVAVGLYVSTHYSDILKLKIEIPNIVRPVSIPSIGFNNSGSASSNGSANSAPVLQTAKPIRISSIRQANNFNGYSELVLFSSLSSGETINITGWTIKSNKGSFSIPSAHELYSFGSSEGSVIVRYGDRVQIYSGSSPKGNFRLNKCMGYIDESNNFNPSVPRNCPYISKSELTSFSGLCQDYISSLRSCQNPDSNPPVPYNDSVCRDFLRNLNYEGCVAKYRNDSDFFTNEWRLWVGNQINIFDPLHDKVQLIDRSGKIVDEYTY